MPVRVTRLALLVLAVLLLPLVQPSPAHGYAEDVANLNGFCVQQFGQPDCNHSTFHYDLVRVLARAAGFCADEADLIGIIGEAVDTGQFQGDQPDSPTIWLQNTVRPNPAGRTGPGQQPIGLYYHFGRRSDAFVGDDTCQYSADTQGPCQVDAHGHLSPEVDELAAWAMDGSRVPRFGNLTISRDGESWSVVEGKTVPALGVFLHALADSYSHEACLQAAGFQGHQLNPPECNAATWHGQDEFGTGQPGLPYTRQAAHAVWQQLRRFRDQWQGPGSAPLWSDEEMTAYVETWTAIADATERQSTANATFSDLNTEHGACGP